MKLSEAIREGAQYHPKALGEFFIQEVDGNYASCALGAAYYSLKGTTSTCDGLISDELLKAWPELQAHKIKMSPDGTQSLFSAITVWNDEGWTREEIADRVQEEGF